ADATKAGNQGGSGGVRVAQDDRGAGVWTDHTGAGIPAVSLAGAGESARRVGADLHDTQYSEASQDLLWIARPLLVERVAEAAHGSNLPMPKAFRKRLPTQIRNSVHRVDHEGATSRPSNAKSRTDS